MKKENLLKSVNPERAITHLNIIASLVNMNALSIITCELCFLTATDLQHNIIGSSLVTHIVSYAPGVSSYWHDIRLQHCQGQIFEVVMGHRPLVIIFIVFYQPSLWTNEASILITSSTPLRCYVIWFYCC